MSGLEKSYGELEVLRGVDFEVTRGSVFALLGSNGAGKTTIVNILATLLKADAGTVTVNGFDVATQPAQVRESFSLTGQFAAVDEILSGRENLVLIAKLRHLADPGAIADGLLDRFSLTDAGERTGVRVLGWDAAPPRHRHEPHRGTAGDLPRRAHDRAGPRGAPRGVGDREAPRRERHDGAAHDAAPRRGRASRRPDRDPPPRPDHRQRNAGRVCAQLLPPAKVEYVEKQPTLEEIFLAVIGNGHETDAAPTTGGRR